MSKLTIVDIHHKVFKKKLNGYDPTDVDQYLDEVIELLEDEAQQREALEAEMSDLRERVSHFKAMEESLHNTLLLAQRTADEVKANAHKEADLIRAEARVSVEKEIASYGDRAAESRREHQRTFEMAEQVKSELRSLLTHAPRFDRPQRNAADGRERCFRPSRRRVTSSTPNVRPRMYPAGRAVIVLAACAPELAGRRLVVEGRRVQAIRFGRLALLLSFVDGDAYAPGALERLRDDSRSLALEARLFERSVERARAHGAVLPMRLLTVFAHPELLEVAAREQYARWSRALARLGAKRECVVHLFAGPHAPPGGAPYVLRITQKAIRTGRAPALKGSTPIVEHARSVWRECAAVATSTRRVPTPGARGALWSSAMLLDERGIDALTATLERSVAAGAPLGVTAYLETPRAPFSFVAER